MSNETFVGTMTDAERKAYQSGWDKGYDRGFWIAEGRFRPQFEAADKELHAVKLELQIAKNRIAVLEGGAQTLVNMVVERELGK